MDRSEMQVFIKKLYAARVDADMAALDEAFADNAKFQISGSPEASMVATFTEGRESVMGLIQMIVDTFDLSDFTILDLLIDGNKAAVRWRAAVTRADTGETFTTELADFLEIEDGKVVSFVQFLDTALAG